MKKWESVEAIVTCIAFVGLAMAIIWCGRYVSAVVAACDGGKKLIAAIECVKP